MSEPDTISRTEFSDFGAQDIDMCFAQVLAAIQQFPEVLHTATSASSVGSSCMSGKVTSSAGGNYDGGVPAVGDKENQPPLRSFGLDAKCWPQAGPPRRFAATIQA